GHAETDRNTVVRAGQTCEIALGMVAAEAVLEGRVAADDGAPVAGAGVHLLGMSVMMSADATADAAGRVRFGPLGAGRYMARLGSDGATAWWVGEVDVPAATRVERTWILGAQTIRGRVVAGADGERVGGAKVYAFLASGSEYGAS